MRRTISGGVTLTILGEPASKANSRKLVTNRKTGRALFIKSDKARAYVKYAAEQLPILTPLMTGNVAATITIYYASQRPDLDEALILDVMQGHIYLNDRQVRERHVYHQIDKVNPRAEIRVEPIK